MELVYHINVIHLRLLLNWQCLIQLSFENSSKYYTLLQTIDPCPQNPLIGSFIG